MADDQKYSLLRYPLNSLHSKLSRRVQFRAENLVGSVITG